VSSLGIIIIYLIARKYIKQIPVVAMALFVFFLFLTPLIFMTGIEASAEEMASMAFVFLLTIFLEAFIKNFIEK